MRERRMVPEAVLPCGCVIRGQDDARRGETWWDARGAWRSPDCDKDHLGRLKALQDELAYAQEIAQKFTAGT